MSTARPNFAVDASKTGQFGDFKLGVKEDLSFWHIVPVMHLQPSGEQIEGTNKGWFDGRASLTITKLYARLDPATDKIWFLEYKCVASRADGITKTMKWFHEDEQEARESGEWGRAMERAAAMNMDKDFCFLKPDISLDVGKLKAAWKGVVWSKSTDNVGGPTMEMLHDSAEPIEG